MSRGAKRKSVIKGFLGLSLLLHLQLIFLAMAVMSLYPDGCAPQGMQLEPFEVSLVQQEVQAASALRPEDLEKEEKKLKEEEKKEEEKDKDAKGQVVELPRPSEEKHPDKARFLSEYDSSVKKETKGHPERFRPGQVVADRPLPAPPTPPSTPPPTPRERERVTRKIMKLAMRPEPEIPRSELPESTRGDEAARMDRRPPVRVKRPRQAPSEEAGPPRRLSLKDLRLSEEELVRALGSRVNDYLGDVDEGEQTLLNSKRWRFASFFNRVKRRVAENWHPDVVYRRRDPTGNVYGFRDRLTILRVKLSPEGKLKELHLERTSGVDFLDDEAVSAFRAAEPFPNPPRGLVDKDTGVISFRFGFLFEISRRPTFRIFRGMD